MKVYFSNRIENLLGQLAEAMARPSQPEAFLAPEYVLIDNKVMGEWLNLKLAETSDIAANIDYLQPSGLFWKLAKWMLGNELPHETPLLKDEMKWKLFALLADSALLEQPGMRPVRDYLGGTEGVGTAGLEADDCRELKRFQLAASIADLFDQYLIYRPDWLRDWQQGKPARLGKGVSDDNELWQSELWRRLVASSTVSGQCWHRAAIEQRLLEIFHNDVDGVVARRVPVRRLLVFGMTSMYPSLVKLLEGLAQHVEVTLFVLNPCREYWGLIADAKKQARQGDDEQYLEIGNPLLASQGVQVQEFIELLCEHDIDDSLFGEGDDQPSTLLQAIQQEILGLTYRGESAGGLDYVVQGDKQVVPEADVRGQVPSIHIHQCHSPQREVEVLHDQLRDMLARNPHWRPRDIVVMMPRVANYVPYIHAVFNSAPEGRRIPYHITDRTLVEESPLLNSFVTLLEMASSRLPLSEVLSLLEVPAIQNRFGLDQGGFEQLRSWLVASGVRWGLDAQQRSALGLPAYADYSWEFGLNRLLAGYGWAVEGALSGAALVDVAQGYAVMPFDEVEGSNASLLDSFLQFWERLQSFRMAVRRARSIGQWHDDLLQLLHDFYAPEDDGELRALNALRAAIEELQKVEASQWCPLPLGIAVIRDFIKPVLQQGAHGRHHWQEGIKFCSLLPMRAVPFRVVYIMGMNQADYPRQVSRKSFDLMRHQHVAGDRASRIDDRWLFLEALLSARETFHVSYMARDMHRNEQREPSVVLSELLDYLKHGYNVPDDWLFTRHPLQPFSPAYFVADGQRPHRLLSFDRQAYAVASARQQEQATGAVLPRWSRSTAQTAEILEVSLNEFVKFFTQPWSWFLSYRHGVDIEVEDDGVEDSEPFAVDNGLDRWGLRSELLAMVNAQAESSSGFARLLDEYVEVRKASARWPVGQAGDAERAGLLAEQDFFYATHGKLIEQETFTYARTVGNVQLVVSGDLPVHAAADGRQLLVHSPGKVSAEKSLEFYIRFAMAHLSTHPVMAAEAIYRDSKPLVIRPEVASAMPLAEFLQQLATLYVEYRHCGLPFDLKAAKAIAECRQDAADAGALYEAIDNYWYGSGWVSGAQDDMKKRLYFGAIGAVKEEAFVAVCEQLQGFILQFEALLKPASKKGEEA